MSHGEMSLATLKGGAAIEAVDALLLEVWENILDPNTEPTQQRKVTLELVFKPDKEREVGHVAIKPSAKLATPRPIESKVSFGRDEHGIACGVELGGFNHNQHILPEVEAPGHTPEEAEKAPDGTKVTPLKRAQGGM